VLELPEVAPLLPPFAPDDELPEEPEEPDDEEPEEETPPPLPPPPPPPPPLRFSREGGSGIEAKASLMERIETDVASGIAAALTEDVMPSAATQIDETFIMCCVV